MQVFNIRNKLGVLSKQSNTTVQLASSTLVLGGRQYDTASLICNLAITGAGGLDVGALVANTTYFVYAILNAGVVALVSSLSNVNPTGFIVSKLVGAFYTDGVGSVLGIYDNLLVKDSYTGYGHTLSDTNYFNYSTETLPNGNLLQKVISGTHTQIKVLKDCTINVAATVARTVEVIDAIFIIEYNGNQGKYIARGSSRHQDQSFSIEAKANDLISTLFINGTLFTSEGTFTVTAQATSPLQGLI